MAAILRFMTLTDLWARAGEISSTAAGKRHALRSDLLEPARLDSARAYLYQSQWSDRARHRWETPEKRRLAQRQPREMPMPRSFNAETQSGKLGWLIHVGRNRIHGALAAGGAVGRSNIVSLRG
jgi:hypothetical protein